VRHLEVATPPGRVGHVRTLARRFGGRNLVRRLRARLSYAPGSTGCGGYVTLNGPGVRDDASDDCVCGCFFRDRNSEEPGGPMARGHDLAWMAPHLSIPRGGVLVAVAEPGRWYVVDVAFDWTRREAVVRVDGAVVFDATEAVLTWRSCNSVHLYNYSGPFVARYASIETWLSPAAADVAFDNRTGDHPEEEIHDY
jgi:hypothetical protein